MSEQDLRLRVLGEDPARGRVDDCVRKTSGIKSQSSVLSFFAVRMKPCPKRNVPRGTAHGDGKAQHETLYLFCGCRATPREQQLCNPRLSLLDSTFGARSSLRERSILCGSSD